MERRALKSTVSKRPRQDFSIFPFLCLVAIINCRIITEIDIDYKLKWKRNRAMDHAHRLEDVTKCDKNYFFAYFLYIVYTDHF
jgi:hypothetical protein